jgi:hypothetical protein
MEGLMNENPMTNLVIPRPRIKSIVRLCIGSSNFSTSNVSAGTCNTQAEITYINWRK